MSFWRFLRNMIVFDWLFGHNHGESLRESGQRNNQRDDDDYSHYDYGGYDSRHYDDYARLNDDYDSGVFDDGLGPSAFDDDFDADSGMFDNDF